MNLMTELDDFDCYLNHQRQEVYGFCLNATCCHRSQFCFQCCKSIHKSHLQDCQSINEILRILCELYQKLESNKDQNQLIHKQIEWILILIDKKSFAQKITKEQKLIKQLQHYNKIIENHFDIIKPLIIQIIELLEMKHYGELKNQIRTLKFLYQFSQNMMDQFSKLLIEIFDFVNIIKLNLELNLKLDHKYYQLSIVILELQKNINDNIIYNIALRNSTIITNGNYYKNQNFSLFFIPKFQLKIIKKLEEEYLPDLFKYRKKLKYLSIFFLGITCEDVSSQANEILKEIEPFTETTQDKNSTICQDRIAYNQINLQSVLIDKNLQQQSSIKKWIYKINEQNEFSYFDSSDEQNSDNIQNFSNKEINEQSIQIVQENTNEEQYNLNEQEQIQLDYQLKQQNQYNHYLLYQTQQIVNVEQYHTIIQLILRELLFQQQNENEIINNSLDYEDHRNIEIKELNNLEDEQHIKNQILEEENQYNLFNQENNNIEKIEQDYNFYLDYLKNQIINEEIYQDQSIENIDENYYNQDYEDHRNIEIEEEN